MKEHIRERLIFQDAKIKNYDIHLIINYAVDEIVRGENKPVQRMPIFSCFCLIVILINSVEQLTLAAHLIT